MALRVPPLLLFLMALVALVSGGVKMRTRICDAKVVLLKRFGVKTVLRTTTLVKAVNVFKGVFMTFNI